MKNHSPLPSLQTQQEALKISKATQRPGQTKEQTKLIAQGIEKGIALYKKQHKEKQRQADKARKKALNVKTSHINATQTSPLMSELPLPSAQNHWFNNARLAWTLLAFSWLIFLGISILKGVFQ
ncbi:MAG: DUF2956 domain-containing protein [Vibrio sp.]